MKNYPLWIAQLPYGSWNDSLAKAKTGEWGPWLPSGASEWKMWQYTWHYDIGGGKKADANVWNGTVDDLDKFLGTKPTMFDRIKRYSNWNYREWRKNASNFTR